LWIQNASWKLPPRFELLRGYTNDAIVHPVFPPYSWLVEHLVLPNFTFFGWGTLILESCLGAFLLVGLATRFWAVVGFGQTLVILLTVLNRPGEWQWSYLLMLLAHAAIFATAAGRYFGVDGVVRPVWQTRPARVYRWLVRAT